MQTYLAPQSHEDLKSPTSWGQFVQQQMEGEYTKDKSLAELVLSMDKYIISEDHCSQLCLDLNREFFLGLPRYFGNFRGFYEHLSSQLKEVFDSLPCHLLAVFSKSYNKAIEWLKKRKAAILAEPDQKGKQSSHKASKQDAVAIIEECQDRLTQIFEKFLENFRNQRSEHLSQTSSLNDILHRAAAPQPGDQRLFSSIGASMFNQIGLLTTTELKSFNFGPLPNVNQTKETGIKSCSSGKSSSLQTSSESMKLTSLPTWSVVGQSSPSVSPRTESRANQAARRRDDLGWVTDRLTECSRL